MKNLIGAGLTRDFIFLFVQCIHFSGKNAERIQNTSLAVSLGIDLGERQRALPSNPDDLVVV